MLFCSNCRKPLPKGHRFCPYCYETTDPIKDSSLCVVIGNLSMRNKRPQLASLFYQAALMSDPENWEAHFNLGCQAWREGKIDKALSSWESSLKSNPNNHLAHFNLGTYFLYNRNLSAARYHLSRVRRIKPDYLAGRVNLGTTYLLLGLFNAAKNEYNYVLKLKPDHVGARRGLDLVDKVNSGKKIKQINYKTLGYN